MFGSDVVVAASAKDGEQALIEMNSVVAVAEAVSVVAIASIGPNELVMMVDLIEKAESE